MANASSGTVTVASKLPTGLLLRSFQEIDQEEQVIGGGMRKFKQHVPTGETFEIKGNSTPHGATPAAPVIDGGFALTMGVPKDLWDQWYAANKNSALVKNGLIFAHSEMRSVEAQAKEKEGVRTGLERLDMDNLPPELKGKIKPVSRQAT